MQVDQHSRLSQGAAAAASAESLVFVHAHEARKHKWQRKQRMPPCLDMMTSHLAPQYIVSGPKGCTCMPDLNGDAQMSKIVDPQQKP